MLTRSPIQNELLLSISSWVISAIFCCICWLRLAIAVSLSLEFGPKLIRVGCTSSFNLSNCLRHSSGVKTLVNLVIKEFGAGDLRGLSKIRSAGLLVPIFRLGVFVGEAEVLIRPGVSFSPASLVDGVLPGPNTFGTSRM